MDNLLDVVNKRLPIKRKRDTVNYEVFAVGLLGGALIGFTQIAVAIPLWIQFIALIIMALAYVRFRYRRIYRLERVFRSERFEQALEMVGKVIEKHPSKVYPYVCGGAACLSLRKAEDAIEFCNRALALQPNNAFALLNRAQAYAIMRDGERALADASEAVRLRPKLGFAYFARAFAYFSLWNYEEAIADWDRAIEMKTWPNKCRINRALCNLAMNKLDEAQAECDGLVETLATKPSPVDLAHLLHVKGLIQSRRRNWSEAIAEYSQALDLFPALRSNLLLDRADALCATDRFDQALKDLDYSEKADCTPLILALIHSCRAKVYLRQGDSERALQEAEKGPAVQGDCPPVLSTHGLILTHVGQLEKAKIMLDHAISLDPYYAEAYWFRHKLYEKLNEPEKAAADKQIAEGYEYKPHIW